MIWLQRLPIVLGLVVLAAHFLRSGAIVAVLLVLSLLALLGVRRLWAARVLQAALVLGALEWLRTLAVLAGERAQEGRPALRMVLILGSVALVTGLSSLLFRAAPLRAWHVRGAPRADGTA